MSPDPKPNQPTQPLEQATQSQQSAGVSPQSRDPTLQQPRDDRTIRQEPLSAAGALHHAGELPPAASESRYRILQLHARGGLGVVYLAEDTELRRRVALKEIQVRHAYDSRSRQRFVLEAEITGRLAHPGIVPVHGLGQHSDGRPYYAMRFVEGETLLDAIQQYHRSATGDRKNRRLVLRQLLAHFVGVCNAVAYAHNQGVIHRDVKPSNVLLGRFGEAVLVDWGLAKYLGVCQAESTALSGDAPPGDQPSPISGEWTLPIDAATQQGSAIGTPAYMSPEQAAGRWNDVGIASDVYNLGATLYTLLTGVPPAAAAGGSGVWLPPPLSAIAAPRVLVADAPAALEAVCKKAMQPKPDDRYAGALDLAADVEHWLGDEPVSAMPESVVTRAGRWARRHLALVSGVSAAILVLGLSLAVGVGLLANANRQITQANDQLLDANHQLENANTKIRFANRQTLQAVDRYFTDVSENPRLLRKEPGTQALRRALLERARDYYDAFLKERGDDATLLGETASACFRLAVIEEQLSPGPKALDLYRRAEAMRVLLGGESGDPDRQFDLAVTRNHIGRMLQVMGKSTEALPIFLRAKDALAELTAGHPDRPHYAKELARVHFNAGITQHFSGMAADSIASCTEARSLLERLVREHPADAEIAHEYAVALGNLGALQGLGGKLAAAIETLTTAQGILDRLAREQPDRMEFTQFLARTTNELAIALMQFGKLPEALEAYEKARQTRERLARENPGVADLTSELAVTYCDIGTVYGKMKRPADAVESSLKALALQVKLAADHPEIADYQRDLARTHNNLGVYYDELYRRTDARKAYDASKTIKERLAATQPKNVELAAELAKSCHNLGNLLLTLGLRDDARAAFEQGRDIRLRIIREIRETPAALLEAIESRQALADLSRDTARTDEALARYQEIIGNAERLPAPSGARARRDALRGRALTLSRAGRHDAALADWEQVLKLDDPAFAPVCRLGHAAALVRSGNLTGLETARAAIANADASPPILLEAARVLALGNEKTEHVLALAALKRCADRKWFADPARIAALNDDAEFAQVRALPEFASWVQTLESNR